MGNKAYFFREVKDITELLEKTKNAVDKNILPQKYTSIATIDLDKQDFEQFSQKFIQTFEFLTPYRERLTMNTDAQYVCVTVRSENTKYEILVNASGYSYARIVAIKNYT